MGHVYNFPGAADRTWRQVDESLRRTLAKRGITGPAVAQASAAMRELFERYSRPIGLEMTLDPESVASAFARFELHVQEVFYGLLMEVAAREILLSWGHGPGDTNQ
ncbi:MAG: hypothetical protein H6934_06370 [Burkholderiaceae bacterium]|nr:hypothetical protein [Burkholderiaceae bacterium]